MTRTIVIDPGHGGSKTVGGSSPNNATGPTGLLEKEAILDLALRVKAHPALLAYRVLMTRETDVNVGINDRARVARDNKAHAFVSIHFNGFNDPRVQGTEAWIGDGGPPECKLLARGLLDRLVAANGLKDRGVKVATSNEYGVVNPANQLSTTAYTLLEVSFMTDPVEEARLRKGAYLDQLAGAIALGIDDFLKKAQGASTPLHFAVRSGSLGTVKALLKVKPKVDQRDENGMTPLMLSAELGHAEIVTYLLKHGANPNARRKPAARNVAAPGASVKAS